MESNIPGMSRTLSEFYALCDVLGMIEPLRLPAVLQYCAVYIERLRLRLEFYSERLRLRLEFYSALGYCPLSEAVYWVSPVGVLMWGVRTFNGFMLLRTPFFHHWAVCDGLRFPRLVSGFTDRGCSYSYFIDIPI